MEKLWSPWRSQYIESFKDKKPECGCVFCNAKEANIDDDSSLVIEKGKYTFTVLNLYPYNNGHLMVVPNRHVNDPGLLTMEENAEVMEKLNLAMKSLKIAINPEGFNLGANIGKVGGAGIDQHIHFHIVPRWNGDTNFMPVIGEVKILSQDLLMTKKALLKAYKEL